MLAARGVRDASIYPCGVKKSAAGDEVTLSVQDDGRGADLAARTSGVGVSGMRERVEMFGETIPRRERAGCRPALRGASAGRGTHCMSGETVTVLLVDDHAVVREQATASCSSAAGNIRVIGEAANADDACARCQELAPQVVVMDIALPGVTGIEAMRRMLGQQYVTERKARQRQAARVSCSTSATAPQSWSKNR